MNEFDLGIIVGGTSVFIGYTIGKFVLNNYKARLEFLEKVNKEIKNPNNPDRWKQELHDRSYPLMPLKKENKDGPHQNS